MTASTPSAPAPALRYETVLRPTLVRGDPDALERAIGNLVDNAVKWSPPNGCVRIAAADENLPPEAAPDPAQP